MKIDSNELQAAFREADAAGHIEPLGIAEMVAALKTMGIEISPTTLRFYMPTGGENRREPLMMGAYKRSDAWLISYAQLARWAAAYKAAAKRGRRGDGSARKSRKK